MIFFKAKTKRYIAFLLLSASLLACKKEEVYYNLPAYGPNQVFYALTNQNTLTVYNAKDVRSPLATITLGGLAATEAMTSIDFRPATGELYGISSLNKLYVIDQISGASRAVSATPFTATASTAMNMDFSAADDRIRIVSTTGQNLRINPETGAVEGTDPNIANSSITGIAHSNNIAGSGTSMLYDIDAAAKKLYKQEPQNGGTLVNVATLSTDLGSVLGFDIAPSNIALAIGKVADSTKLYTIDLSNGKMTLSGKFVRNTNVRAIAIPTNPVAYAVDDANNLLIFNPVSATSFSRPITGLQLGETVYAMDMRPANGQLYALGSSNRLYRLNMATGAATMVGNGPLGITLTGSTFGFDFNPLTDVIQVVGNTGQQFRIDPTTGNVTIGTNFPSTATISAIAYSNNFRGASSTTLYLIDHASNKLLTQNANTGVLTAVGDLKITVGTVNSFDIVYNASDLGFGVFTVGGKTGLYGINLTTGAASAIFDFPKPITAFTLGLKLN